MTVDYLSHENEYRGDDVVARRGKFPVVIMGAGALGSWLVDLLARQGYSNLTVIDFDKIESKNFGTQNYGERDKGRKKAPTLAANIYLRLKVVVQSIDERVTATNVKKLIKGAKLVVDVFDNAESRNLIKSASQESGIEALHCGLSGDGFCEIEWNDEYRAHPARQRIVDGVPCEYPLASNLVHLAVGLTAEAINKYIDSGVKQRIHFTLKDLHVHVLE